MSVFDKIALEQRELHIWLETSDGIEVRLDSWGNSLLDIDGLGSAPIENIFTKNGFRGGVQLIGQRGTERYFRLNLSRKGCGCFGACADVLSGLPNCCSCCNTLASSMRYLHRFFKAKCGDDGKLKPMKLWFQHCDDERRFALVYPSVPPAFNRSRTRPQWCYQTQIELFSPSPYIFGDEVCDTINVQIDNDGQEETHTSSVNICSDAPLIPCFKIRMLSQVLGTYNDVVTIENLDNGASFQFVPSSIFTPTITGPDYTVTICPYDSGANRHDLQVSAFDNIANAPVTGPSVLQMITTLNPPNAFQLFEFQNSLNWSVTYNGLPNSRTSVELCVNPRFDTV